MMQMRLRADWCITVIVKRTRDTCNWIWRRQIAANTAGPHAHAPKWRQTQREAERERERERVKIQFEESQMSRSSVGAHFQIWFAALRHCLGADLNKMKWNSWNEKKKKQNGENGSSSKTVARWKCTSRWPEGPAEKNKKIVSSAGEILVGASIQMAADLLLSGRDDPAAFNSFFWLVPLVGWSLPKSESA